MRSSSQAVLAPARPDGWDPICPSRFSLFSLLTLLLMGVRIKMAPYPPTGTKLQKDTRRSELVEQRRALHNHQFTPHLFRQIQKSLK